MKPNNFRSKVMKYAHQYFNQTHKAWRLCMIKAWELYRLASKMRKGIAKFAYTKVDGSVRMAVGTLVGVPAGATLNGKKHTKPSYKTMAYYDLEKESFRCFKIENLVTVY